MVHGSWLFIHGQFWARLLQLPPSGDGLPPLSRWSCSARRGRVKRKGRDASEQLQPFHTPATKSAITTVDMMRKDDDE